MAVMLNELECMKIPDPGQSSQCNSGNKTALENNVRQCGMSDFVNNPLAMATTEVLTLVASFLISPNELVKARVFNPDVWRGTKPRYKIIYDLLKTCPLSGLQEFIHMFANDESPWWKGLRGIWISENESERDHICWFLGACEGGQLEILTELRTRRESMLDRSSENVIPDAFFLAAACGWVNILQELRTNWGWDLGDVRPKINEAFTAAVCKGYVAVLVELRVNWNVKSRHILPGMTSNSLVHAARCGWLDVIVELRKNWSEINQRELYIRSLMLERAASNDRVEVLQELCLHWDINMLHDIKIFVRCNRNKALKKLRKYLSTWEDAPSNLKEIMKRFTSLWSWHARRNTLLYSKRILIRG